MWPYGLFGMQENMVLKNLLVNKFFHSFKKKKLKQLLLKLKTKYQKMKIKFKLFD